MKLTLSQLEQYLSKAAWILKGPIGASDFKAYIFPMLFFKRISDVYDEEYQNALEESDGDKEYAALPEFHRFNIPEGCHWDDVRETTSNVGLKIERCLRAIESANQEHLYGIFGDAQWSNKDKLPDRLLTDLVEHFSQYTLSTELVARDMLGQAYEYLIKRFADLTNKKAGEFYTPRSVVHLMGLIIDPHEGESIYDPACGTGGMLIESIEHLKGAGEDFRTLKLYGQEKNLTSSSIARMNMFLHGIEEFQIVRGDTLSEPKLLENDQLKTFNVILANPPYSIKAWDRSLFENDPWGRNLWGTPPKGCADYAFQQHIQKSLDPKNGRYAILWAHGILFRDAELTMRKKMLETDTVEAVIGLGGNLFYNSPMEAMILVGNTNKPKKRRSKVLFIDGLQECMQEKNHAHLTEAHIQRVFKAFRDYTDIPHFAAVVENEAILANNANMSVHHYVKRQTAGVNSDFGQCLADWQTSSKALSDSMESLFSALK